MLGPFSWLRRLFRAGDSPGGWPVIQIEVTSRCPMRCVFCPTKTLGSQWLPGDLPWDVYRDCLGPHLARFGLAYLQGWGEPMLHPHLWDMARLAKSAGCRVGFTTCGSLLNEENSRRVLDEGIDILSVSFAGASAPTHEALRVGSDFARLTANVARIAARRGQARLRLELHFLMLRANLHELPSFVRLAAALGADEVVATNLSYTPTPELDAMRVFGRRPDPAHQASVAEARREANGSRVQFRVYPLEMDDNILECDAHPSETVFVNHRGEVTPCVITGAPVSDCVPRIFEGEPRPTPPVSFGNIRAGLIQAMHSRARAAFTAPLKARQAWARAALALSIAGGAGDAPTLPDPPQPCRHCYKLYGV